MSSKGRPRHDKYTERRPGLLELLERYPNGITTKALAFEMAINEKTAYRYMKLMVREGVVQWASSPEAHYCFMIHPDVSRQEAIR